MLKQEKTTIIIREGNHSDNEGLVRLTSMSPMMGKISIRIDRMPDFFRLLEMRGPSFVLVAEWNNSIIGSYSVSAVNVFINNKPETAYYLGDFKVHPDFRKSLVAVRLAKEAIQRLEKLNADLLFSTVAIGNEAVAPFLKGRASFPEAENTGIFNIYQMIPFPFKPRITKYQFEEKPFTSAYLSFFNDFISKYQFGTVYTEKCLENTILITASFNNQIVAAICLMDAVKMKQNVLIGLSFYLKYLSKLINAINLIFKLIRLPRINEVVRIMYIKSFSYNPKHEDALKLLIKKARNLAYKNKYHFLNIGIHEKDPVRKIFSKQAKFTFKSSGYICSLKGNRDKVESILQGIQYEDFSMV